jgi:hypothetical protein
MRTGALAFSRSTHTYAAVRRAPLGTRSDVEVAVALARLTHEEYELYGTDGSQQLTNEQAREALLTLGAVVDRLNVQFDAPFRDFTTFRNWWIRQGASGSGGWQARECQAANARAGNDRVCPRGQTQHDAYAP